MHNLLSTGSATQDDREGLQAYLLVELLRLPTSVLAGACLGSRRRGTAG